jgi:hypothetical protein
MESLKRQTVIAVLWISAAVVMSAHMVLMMLDPVALQKAGQWAAAAGAADWVFTAVFWLVPLWMAFVTVAAGPLASRRANIAAGILLTVLNAYHFLVCALPIVPGGPYAGPTVHHVLLVGSTVVSTGLVTWFAWTWPGRNARQVN